MMSQTFLHESSLTKHSMAAAFSFVLNKKQRYRLNYYSNWRL